MIAEVYLWIDDGKVTVFDERGHQMWDYSGFYRLVAGRILSDAPLSARFYQANLAVGSREPITREQFSSLFPATDFLPSDTAIQ